MTKVNTSEIQKAYNAKMIEILKYFINFCKKNDLTYWGAYGTAIGAVRHHSIIPWDDDIDLLMPRDCYNKLINKSKEFNNGQYELVHPRLGNDCTCRVIHICDKNTTVINRINFPVVNGVHIGISPIDFSDETDIMIKKHAEDTFLAFKNYFNCFFHYTGHDMIKNILHPRSLMWILKNLFYDEHAKEKFKIKALELDGYYDRSDGNKAFNMHELMFNKDVHIFKKEWFSSSILMPFEDFQISLPSGYHEYLTMQYGDYMSPPPVNQQKPHHLIDYFNLKEHLDVNEAIKRFKTGRHYEY